MTSRLLRIALVGSLSCGLVSTADALQAPRQGLDQPTVAKPTAPAKTPTPAQKPDSKPEAPPAEPLPMDLTYIQQQASTQSAVKLNEQQLRFYAQAWAKALNFNDYLGNYDLKNGPTKGGAAMTHQEFLNMVTPKELNELFGSTSGSSFAMAQAAVMNAAGQALLKKGVQAIRQAKSEEEVREIRERIDRELAALLAKAP